MSVCRAHGDERQHAPRVLGQAAVDGRPAGAGGPAERRADGGGGKHRGPAVHLADRGAGQDAAHREVLLQVPRLARVRRPRRPRDRPMRPLRHRVVPPVLAPLAHQAAGEHVRRGAEVVVETGRRPRRPEAPHRVALHGDAPHRLPARAAVGVATRRPEEHHPARRIDRGRGPHATAPVAGARAVGQQVGASVRDPRLGVELPPRLERDRVTGEPERDDTGPAHLARVVDVGTDEHARLIAAIKEARLPGRVDLTLGSLGDDDLPVFLR